MQPHLGSKFKVGIVSGIPAIIYRWGMHAAAPALEVLCVGAADGRERTAAQAARHRSEARCLWPPPPMHADAARALVRSVARQHLGHT